jgi:hypothetical protein
VRVCTVNSVGSAASGAAVNSVGSAASGAAVNSVGSAASGAALVLLCVCVENSKQSVQCSAAATTCIYSRVQLSGVGTERNGT